MRVVSQASDSVFPEFVENARWSLGGFVFATIHVVGSGNGLGDFEGRTSEHDREVARRTAAAIDWLNGAFAAADSVDARGVVIALHGNMGLEGEPGTQRGHERFVSRLREQVTAFPGQVLLIHGDSHDQHVDQPLRDDEGRIFANFTRLETFGSPDIGWVRVVVDSVAGRVTQFEPRRFRGWW